MTKDIYYAGVSMKSRTLTSMSLISEFESWLTLSLSLFFQQPFYIAAGLACLSFVVILLFVPEVKIDGMAEEDEKFRVYLAENGFDVDRLGLPVEHDDERQNSLDEKKEKDANGVVVSAKEV